MRGQGLQTPWWGTRGGPCASGVPSPSQAHGSSTAGSWDGTTAQSVHFTFPAELEPRHETFPIEGPGFCGTPGVDAVASVRGVV